MRLRRRYRPLCLEQLDARRVLAALVSEGEIEFPYEINLDWDEPISDEGIDLEALCGRSEEVRPIGDFNGDQIVDLVYGNSILFGPSDSWTSACSNVEINHDADYFNLLAHGDFDGDGLSDLLFQAATRNTDFTYHYRRFLIYGNETPPAIIDVDQMLPGQGTEFVLREPNNFVRFESLSDLNGDGSSELLATFRKADPWDPHDYAILFGGVTHGTITELPINDASLESFYDNYQDIPATYFFDSIGDINGDGYDDFGSRRQVEHSSHDSPAHYVIFGNADHTVRDIETYEFDGIDGFRVIGSQQSLNAHAVQPLGDFNGDGIDDFAVESQCSYDCDSAEARSSVVFGKHGTHVSELDIDTAPSNVSFTILGYEKEEYGRYELKPAGDVNGDGFDDAFLSGTYFASPYFSTYLLLGSPDIYPNRFRPENYDLPLVDLSRRGPIGNSRVGDINLDGFDDVVGGGIIFGRDIPLPNPPTPVSWTNAANRFDVDGSGTVSIGDALTIVSSLRNEGSRQLPILYLPNRPFAYLDVNGDGRATISDALEVVRAIIRSSTSVQNTFFPLNSSKLLDSTEDLIVENDDFTINAADALRADKIIAEYTEP